MIDAESALTELLPPAPPLPVLTACAEVVGLARPLEIVDAGASPLVGEPPRYAGLVEAGIARVTGFEPDPAAMAALSGRISDRERYLPTALGDGHGHTLRVCAEAGFSSLLEPDAGQLAVLTDFPRLAEVTAREHVTTARLDDIDEVSCADLLVLDVQGSEPAILDGATRILGTTVAVQVEVAFHRLYEDGPTLADVDGRLRRAGLVPHAFVTGRTWPLAPITWDDPLQSRARHLVEADLLYVRDPARLEEMSPNMLRALALAGCGAYDAVGLALICLRELIRRGEAAPDSEGTFRRIVTAPSPDEAREGRR